jgi:proton-translocating NAD(P)+ transhydrogenase subunit alpha
MTTSLIEALYLLVLAGFVGFEVIRRVPPLLHTPLMSATNAISGISIVGALVAAGTSDRPVSILLGCIAVTAAAINVVGGFMITDRMLRMFRPGGSPRSVRASQHPEPPAAGVQVHGATSAQESGDMQDTQDSSAAATHEAQP